MNSTLYRICPHTAHRARKGLICIGLSVWGNFFDDTAQKSNMMDCSGF